MNIDELNTPCYIINSEDYDNNIKQLMSAYEDRWKGKVIYGYSVKTNHFPYMIKRAGEYGWMAEVVSPDEYHFAKKCGFSDDRIIYNGPQKRKSVVDACINGAVVNLDNLEEVELICDSLSEEQKRASRIGIRINFDLERECPGETTCRDVVGRFGISLENGDVKRAVDMLKAAGIQLKGLHMHQSSSSRSLRIYEAIARKVIEITDTYELNELDYIDMGGGYFGGNFFPGKPTPQQYAQTICEELSKKEELSGLTLILEPGAAVLATSMDYLVSVLNIRDIRGKRVVTVDGSVVHINPFMNPHPTPFTMLNPGEETDMEQIVGGSTCMEMDRIYPRDIHNMIEHDTKLLFHCCGAYMSTHNSSFINAAPNIYVKKDGEYSLVRQKNPDQMLIY